MGRVSVRCNVSVKMAEHADDIACGPILRCRQRQPDRNRAGCSLTNDPGTTSLHSSTCVGRAVLRGKEKWIGPFRIDRLLASCHDASFRRPGVTRSCYVVTQRRWAASPSRKSFPLYVGGNTGKSKRFRTRLGDLLADAFGFFGSKATGRHSGGQSLFRWCRRHNVNPLKLHVAWVQGVKCHRCLEVRLCQSLDPKLNRVSPARCKEHPETMSGL